MNAAPSQVVVGYDGSDHAREALNEVRRIAQPGATVTVVYAHRVPPELQYYEFFQDVLGRPRTGAKEKVQSARKAFEGADLHVSYEVRRGGPGEVLADVAREQESRPDRHGVSWSREGAIRGWERRSRCAA